MSPWKKGLIVADIVAALLLAGGIVWMVRRAKDDKEHPEKYKHKVKKA